MRAASMVDGKQSKWLRKFSSDRAGGDGLCFWRYGYGVLKECLRLCRSKTEASLLESAEQHELNHLHP
jgi:hypothetical protein